LENKIKIGDFVQLSGSTLKTIMYYHKIGLLQEPERSPGGYRLYGPSELSRMRLIKHLKSLGLDLKRVKDILGDIHNLKTLREVLQSLRVELLCEIKILGERVGKIEELLNEETVRLKEDAIKSPSFQMITEMLGTDQMTEYARTCPEIFDQHRKVFGILDDFQWGEDYRETFRALAEYFDGHPQLYQVALDYGKRLARLAHLPEDDPEIEMLARDSTELIKNTPLLESILCNQSGPKKPFESLYNNMVAGVLSPAQMKYKQLFEQYLNLQS
jgi:DNA-binding transcriptional MerR regulator